MRVGGYIFGILVLIAILAMIIGFVLKWGLLIAGIILLIVGLGKLQEDKEKGIKRKLPAILAIIGLIVGLTGVGVAFAYSPSDSTPKTSTSSNIHKKEISKTPSTESSTQDKKEDDSTSSKENDSTSSTATTVTVTDNSSTSQQNDKSTSQKAPAGLVAAVVSKNVDGDTIHVKLNGKDETIRMLLIDTPEDVDPNAPVEPFAYDAANYAKKVLPVGKHIYLQLGKKGYERDKYDRLLAYVYITPTDMYNYDVVKKGLARVAYIYPPNTDHLSELQSAQSYAKSHKLGIWSIAGYVDSDGYDLKIACNYAEKNGYSTRGCGTTSTATTIKPSTSTKPKTSNTKTTVTGSTLTVSPGQMASITIKTKPGAKGTITVVYKSGPSTAKGLEPKTADSKGYITWTWKIGSRTSAGSYPITIKVNGTTIHKTLIVR